MALDAVTYGRVEEAEENILKNINDVKSTVDTLPEKVGEKLDPVQTDMAQLVENVQKQVDELRTIVENSPAGIPAPYMNKFNSESQDDGILITYRPYACVFNSDKYNITLDDGSNLDVVLSKTKGVMVRYSESNYPLSENEGILAFIDEDIYDVDSNGVTTTKEKQQVITSLTQNKTYYISAFPYSTNNVYNVSAGRAIGDSVQYNNRTKCQWTGTKGTLTVNVTQDYDYKPLGEYTATMTPTAGGQAITKTQSGAATIVFSWLEAGEYTLSFSDVTSFTKPQNQSVTVVAGTSKTIDLQYKFTLPSLSSCTWKQIDEYSSIASNFWSIGDTKDITVNGETLTFEIVGFNHDNLSDGTGKAGITFGMKNLMANTRSMNSSDTNKGSYAGSDMNTFVGTTFYNGMPVEVRNVIKSVKKVTGNSTGSSSWSGTRTDNFKTWLFSEAEVFSTKTHSVGNEGSKYARFTSDSLRTKKLSNGSGSEHYWWLRSPSLHTGTYFCLVDVDGHAYKAYASNSYGVCVGFCV